MPRTLVTRTPTSPTPTKSTLSIQIGPLTRPPGLILKSKVRMASAAQIAANRRNSLRATGPRTAAGKARSSRNARKHGLYARDEAPSGEDAAALGDLTEAYLETFDPKDSADASLVRRLALVQWRLSRAAALEAELLNRAIARANSHDADPDRALGRAVSDCSGALTKLSRWESRLDRALSRHS